MLILTPSQLNTLAGIADSSIAGALNGTLAGWKASAPKAEPDAVAAVVSAGLPGAAAGWTSTLSPLGYNVQIVGVFCHGTPYVQFSDHHGVQQTPCELADVLIVIDEATTLSWPDRRGLLVQAKLAVHPHKRLSGGELIQLDLYQRFPDFRFQRGPYPRNVRNVRGPPGVPSQGFAYGTIDLLPAVVAWEQMAPANPLVAGSGSSLGTIVAAMAAGAGGREAVSGGTDDWSNTIDELLTTTATAAAGGSFGGVNRGVTTLAYMSAVSQGLGVGFIHTPPSLDAPDGGPGPMSVVYVRISQFECGS